MTKVIHIASKRMLMELFSLNGVCPFMMQDDGRRNVLYCCGGKVMLKEVSSEREGVGMVDDEDTNGNFVVKLEVGETTVIKRPTFVENFGTWDYSSCHNEKYQMVQYDPIRIRILKSGTSSIVMNRFVRIES